MSFFSIIIPTYKRADKLSRAVSSVLNQGYQNFEIIIVNDSPEEESYESFEKNISDPRIKYFKNKDNMGVNYSRNFALDNLSPNSNFIIFLDDDDWFEQDCLLNFEKLTQANPNENWFITNRTLLDGKSLTSAPKNNARYSYAIDYLISKRIKGDATHCIKTSEVQNVRFPKKVKQGEEWFFFYQIGLKNKLYYSSYDSTISEGYDTNNGLNFRKQSKLEKIKNTLRLLKEGRLTNLWYRPSFAIYILIRLIVSIFK